MDNCPLSGKPCSKAKTFHVTEISNNGTKNLNLCQSCIEGYLSVNGGGFHPTQTVVEKMLDLLKFKSLNTPKPEIECISEEKCPKCNTGLSDIFKGKIGCPNCYAKFEKELKEISIKLGNGITHVGKVPTKCADKYEEEMKKQFFENDTTIVSSNYMIQKHVNELQILLDNSVKEEKYEIAQKCKDAIEEIDFLKAQKGVLDCEFMNAALRNDAETAKNTRNKMQELVDLCLKQKV